MNLRIALFCITLLISLAAAETAGAANYVVVLKDGVDPTAAARDQAAAGAKVYAEYRDALTGYAASLSPTQLAAARADSRVQFVTADRKVGGPERRQPRPSTQFINYANDRIDADTSTTRSGDGHGAVDVNVAVIDSGIDFEQPDLNVAGGVDCTDGTRRPGGQDTQGHGTLVSGIIGAKDNRIGYVGVVPGARLYAARVLDDTNSGTMSTILCGMDWVASTRTDRNPRNDIAVANLSLGGDAEEGNTDDGHCGRLDKDALHVGICGLVAAGVVPVASAMNDAVDFGNLGAGVVVAPAAFDEVLTATSMTDYDGLPGGTGQPADYCRDSIVSSGDALDADDSKSGFSNFATLPADPEHTLAGSGTCVSSTYPVSICRQYNVPDPRKCSGFASGTSFAAPQVAGTAALCIATHVCVGQPRQIIRQLVDDAARYNRRHPEYGFAGDPLRPVAGRYYGWLVRAGIY